MSTETTDWETFIVFQYSNVNLVHTCNQSCKFKCKHKQECVWSDTALAILANCAKADESTRFVLAMLYLLHMWTLHNYCIQMQAQAQGSEAGPIHHQGKNIKFTCVLHFLCSCLTLMSINILCFCTSLYLCLCHTFEVGLWKDYISVSRCSYTPDCCDSCGSTPLMDALRTGHVLVAETLIKEHKVQESNMKVWSIVTKDAISCSLFFFFLYFYLIVFVTTYNYNCFSSCVHIFSLLVYILLQFFV